MYSPSCNLLVRYPQTETHTGGESIGAHTPRIKIYWFQGHPPPGNKFTYEKMTISSVAYSPPIRVQNLKTAFCKIFTFVHFFLGVF